VLEKISSLAIGKASGDMGRGYERLAGVCRMQDIGDLKSRVSVSFLSPSFLLGAKIEDVHK